MVSTVSRSDELGTGSVMETIGAIIVAVIAGPMMWFLARFDRRNTEQHAENQALLGLIDTKMDRLDGKVDRLDRQIDSHLTWHETREQRKGI